MGGLFGGAPSAPSIPPPPPPPPPPAPMPVPDDESAKKAKRRSIASQQGRSGRLSTILSDGGNETLG